MKIVLDTIPLIYSNGADRRTTYHLFRELFLNDSYNSYALFCIDRRRREDRYASLIEQKRIPVYTVPLPVRTLRWAWSHLAWPKLERISGPADLYHVAGIIAAPTHRAKVLVTIRGIVAEVIPEYLPADKVRRLKKVLREAMRHADYYLAVSEKTKQDMVSCLGINPDSIFVCPHGVDPQFKPISDRKAVFGFLKKKFRIVNPYVLYVGAIGYHKNVQGILQAYRLLREKGCRSHDLVLAGFPDSAWDYAAQFIGRFGMEPHIHLTGPIAQEIDELTCLYNGADCFVFPSFYEGWCSPPVEAMACGTPVIASNCSSLPETAGDAACLVDPHDPEEISNRIEDILTQRDFRDKLIEKGFRRAADLNWRASALNLMEIYRTIEGRAE